MKHISTLVLCILLAFLTDSALAQNEAEQNKVNYLQEFNSTLGSLLMFDITGGMLNHPKLDKQGFPVLDDTGHQLTQEIQIPFLVAVLASGAIFFTFFYGFVHLFWSKHAVQVVAGKFDCEEDAGEISHFKALTSALSATIGLGNIAGVAVAVQTGGPGAILWMIFLAAFGMSAKFSSCTLALLYRKILPSGRVYGGPMYYLDIGLKSKGPVLAVLGKFLAVMYAFMIMGGALGGGNMFQSNQTVEAFTNTFDLPAGSDKIIGVVMAVLVGVVILGGIRRIAFATSKIVPAMCALYVLACITVLITNLSSLPSALVLIFTKAFSQNAALGGTLGVMVTGMTRAAFSNEAGLGSAAIAHAAAKTNEPVREGMVAMLGPFIDTIIICFMTALVIVVTGVWENPELAAAGGNVGVTLTSSAFATVIPWFPYVLTICIALFAYSTMISWCYYGEVGWIYLMDHFGNLGLPTVFLFRLIFVLFVFFGATSKLDDVITFSDLMILSMAFPNILGSLILAPKVRERLKDYQTRMVAKIRAEA
jgi:AGCS family alanine or glycine:cation symporter